MTSKLTVTIGIPAYNEQEDIGNLVKAVLSQQKKCYELKEIIVVSDASTDNTDTIVKNINSRKIRLIRNPKRLGQQYCQNLILEQADANVIVVVEADTIPANKLVIDRLVAPLTVNADNIGMVIGVSLPVRAESFYEQVLNFGYRLRSAIFNSWRNGINVYSANGQAIKAISRKFSKVVNWPSEVPEDAFIYFTMLQNGYTMVRVTSAVSLMRNPTLFKDRTKHVAKFQAGRKVLENYFDPELVRREYAIPWSLLISYSAKALITNPILAVCYAVDVALNRLLTVKNKTFKALYEPYYSSKKLKVA